MLVASTTTAIAHWPAAAIYGAAAGVLIVGVLIGAAPELINFFFNAGLAVH